MSTALPTHLTSPPAKAEHLVVLAGEKGIKELFGKPYRVVDLRPGVERDASLLEDEDAAALQQPVRSMERRKSVEGVLDHIDHHECVEPLRVGRWDTLCRNGEQLRLDAVQTAASVDSTTTPQVAVDSRVDKGDLRRRDIRPGLKEEICLRPWARSQLRNES